MLNETARVSCDYFMADPSVYTNCNQLQKMIASSIIKEFDEDLIKISGKCMDIGCGPADITNDVLLPALDPNAVIIGTDCSENMIKHAEKTYGDKKQLKFEVIDIQTKNLPNEYVSEFDHIFSFHTFHWCQNVQQVFENIYRMLRLNGTILLNFVTSNVTFDIFTIMANDNRFAQYKEDIIKCISPYYPSAQPDKDIKKLLRSIGFKIKHCSLRIMSLTQDSDDFIYSIISVCGFLHKMPCEQAEEFKNEFICNYKEKIIKCKITNNNQEQTLLLNKCRYVIIHAQKVV